MRISRVRFTVRRLMLGVAIVGLLLGFIFERRSRFERLSIEHHLKAGELMQEVNESGEFVKIVILDKNGKPVSLDRREYHLDLSSGFALFARVA
jgi:hypothetical protein